MWWREDGKRIKKEQGSKAGSFFSSGARQCKWPVSGSQGAVQWPLINFQGAARWQIWSSEGISLSQLCVALSFPAQRLTQRSQMSRVPGPNVGVLITQAFNVAIKVQYTVHVSPVNCSLAVKWRAAEMFPPITYTQSTSNKFPCTLHYRYSNSFYDIYYCIITLTWS